ncbi:LAQU0S09e03488g1_1 [Lachancea quebecensis]|uniref:aminodeoxychorismate synthase n=1 Tax=Lachancea quebecensis TaxID=1654605 RepID=A0A0P1KT74_9SACH|nr:LAQU0S09e03488g1_1 [Lachancea quebecensis]
MVLNVLFVDFYDSFTYNLVSLIRDQGQHVTIIHFDSYGEDIERFWEDLQCFDCIVLGPGPGNPENGFADVGFMDQLFARQVDLPVLGVCLGFQLMCKSMGCTIEQLSSIKHGQVYDVKLSGDAGTVGSLFEGYPSSFKSVRYHSLHVNRKNSDVSRIIPLAYTDDEGEFVLMGAQIANKPWYGVQYHPESCCSELGGKLIRNFLEITERHKQDRVQVDAGKNLTIAQDVICSLDQTIDKSSIYPKKALQFQEIQIEEFQIEPCTLLALQICKSLTSPFFLMSSSTIHENRGEFSIIALPNERSTVYTHYDQVHRTLVHQWRDSRVSLAGFASAAETGVSCDGVEIINQSKHEFWKTLGTFMQPKLMANNPEIPFIGGLVGVMGYEMGQFTVHDCKGKLVPDAKMVYVENSVIVDYQKGALMLISLNNSFPEDVRSMVMKIVQGAKPEARLLQLPDGVEYDITMPTKESYTEAYNKSQKYLNKGDSYEVCLTTQTRVVPSKRIEPWRIFQTLICRNPAPFSSFFEFTDIEHGHSDLCLLSTSPERFLKWDSDTCELRPIKGTVKKDGNTTRELATKILKTPKEFGENLMILDLIRNDLYELLDVVTVDELMSVEEYETVYQLVSVVRGHGLRQAPYSGIDLLQHSLPPGSMTGAPKRKTVELLHDEIEKELNSHISASSARGVYSGVTGYMSCNDRGDWSVNIRCMFSYDNARTWRLGAGGAVTVLSTLEGEWQEMLTKLESALQVFQN